MIEISVATDTGYKAEVKTVASGESVEVQTAAYIVRNILSPFITLKRFTGEEAQKKADNYARRLVAALLDKEENV